MGAGQESSHGLFHMLSVGRKRETSRAGGVVWGQDSCHCYSELHTSESESGLV